MAEMTPRERILTALKIKEPDRVPFFDSLDQSVKERIMGRKEFSFVDLAEKTGMDAIGIDLFPPLFCIRRKMDGIDHVVAGLIKKDEDLKLMEFPDPDDDSVYEDVERFVEKYGGEKYAIFARIRLGASPTLLSMGLDGFSYALYENPTLIDKVFDQYAEWCGSVASRLNKCGVDFLWSCDDIADKNSTFFSPSVFREIFLPRMKKVADKISLPWIYHSDGNLMPVIDDLLTLNMSCLHPLEPGPMNIAEVKKLYGKRICLMGNIDLHYTLTRGTPDEVDAEVKQRILEAGPGGGYIVSSANSIPDYVPTENFMAMSAAVKKYGNYPLD
jgi:uroporphyrinogen decarboxylase